MHLVDHSVGMMGSTPIVGGSLPIAVGLAFATQMKKQNQMTIVFFGEGATEEGVFGECLNFASLRKLPVLFVCENNLYSVYSPLEVRQSPERDRVAIAAAHGIEAKTGYGNDVEMVYRMAKEAIDSIREGKGPVFLEFDTYRHRAHCGPSFDNHIGYRTEEEFQLWEKKCPLKNFQNKLPETEFQAIRSLILLEIQEAFDFANKSPFPRFDMEMETPYA
jgi:pyruvate dehydrogenase E1 component alpha subunit